MAIILITEVNHYFCDLLNVVTLIRSSYQGHEAHLRCACILLDVVTIIIKEVMKYTLAMFETYLM